MRIAVLLGSPDISGGSYVIFQHAMALMRAGHNVSIVTEEKISQSRLDWFPEAKALDWMCYNDLPNQHFDIAIATWWKTIYELYRVEAARYAYFVQSVESWFYPEEEKPLRKLVEATYTLPLFYITEATWIQRYLANQYNQSAALVRNGIRKDIYLPEGEKYAERDPEKLRVLVEGTIEAPFKNVPRTIELCRQSDADEIWLMTPSTVSSYKGVDRLFSKIPAAETANVYRSCDVIVKLSYVEGMFGPPLEMYHCGGTSITYNVTGHDEYIVDGVNGIVIPSDHETEVIEAINMLRRDKQRLKMLEENALHTAENWPDWDKASERFVEAVEEFNKKPPMIRQKDLEIVTKFHFDSYVLAENYRLELLPKSKSFFIRAKEYIKKNCPAFFNLLKKVKISLTKHR